MTGFDPPSRSGSFARYGEAAPKLLAWTDREKRRRDLRPLTPERLERGCAGEAYRVPVVRALDAIAPLAGAHGSGLAAPVDRAGRGRRGTGRRRRLLPRAPLRAPTRLAVSPPRGHRRAHPQDRDWH